MVSNEMIRIVKLIRIMVFFLNKFFKGIMNSNLMV